MTKKILFGILTFLGIGFSFCSAGEYIFSGHCDGECSITRFSVPYNDIDGYGYTQTNTISNVNGNGNLFQICCTRIYQNGSSNSNCTTLASNYLLNSSNWSDRLPLYCNISSLNNSSSFDYSISFSGDSIISNSSSSSSASTINVFYNNQQSTETITCDGDNSIFIDGYSTLTSISKFTPYFNINYRDQDNQLLTESYDKSLLILSGGNFKKTYTGDNDWILNLQESSIVSPEFTGYLPTFDVVVTGDLVDTGNIFNNFAENSLKFTLSNIPSYIQYVIIILILFFVLGFVKKFRRK